MFEKKTFEEAQSICQNNGMEIASVDSFEEAAFIGGLVGGTHWIGGKYNSDDFKWVDGSNTEFTNWYDPYTVFAEGPYLDRDDAEAHCAMKGGELASVYNESEKSQLLEAIKVHDYPYSGNFFWTGLNKQGGAFKWNDGT